MAMKIEPAQLAVLGTPIAHSQSPVIHNAAYAAMDLPWQYSAVECDTPDLEAFLQNSSADWRGFSVTMPLKAEAHRLALVHDPVALESGVVNTLLRVIDGPSGPQWAGFNTDVSGLAAALRNADLDATHTVVLGAGATATSAVMAARQLGAHTITVRARRAEAAAALAARFDGTQGPINAVSVRGIALDADVEADADAIDGFGRTTLVISTLPGPATVDLLLPDSLLSCPLFDVAYDPWPSPLANRWEAAGSAVHAGIDMLLEQAVVQLRIFVTGDPNTPVDNEAAVRERMHDAGMGR